MEEKLLKKGLQYIGLLCNFILISTSSYFQWACNECFNMFKTEILTLKEPGYCDPSHSRRGADSAPLKISEIDRWNIKCGTSG